MSKQKSEHHFVEILEDSQAVIDSISKMEKENEKRSKWERIGIRILAYGTLAAMLIADLLGFFRMACGYWP
jgi:ribonuclease HI